MLNKAKIDGYVKKNNSDKGLLSKKITMKRMIIIFMCIMSKLGLWLWKQPYFVAETTMPGKTGFDFNGASQSFNVLAEYLFGKVVLKFCNEFLSYLFVMYLSLLLFFILALVLFLESNKGENGNDHTGFYP